MSNRKENGEGNIATTLKDLKIVRMCNKCQYDDYKYETESTTVEVSNKESQ